MATSTSDMYFSRISVTSACSPCLHCVETSNSNIISRAFLWLLLVPHVFNVWRSVPPPCISHPPQWLLLVSHVFNVWRQAPPTRIYHSPLWSPGFIIVGIPVYLLVNNFRVSCGISCVRFLWTKKCIANWHFPVNKINKLSY